MHIQGKTLHNVLGTGYDVCQPSQEENNISWIHSFVKIISDSQLRTSIT